MTLPATQVLRRTPLFATLTEDDLRRVAAVAVPRKYGRKETVFPLLKAFFHKRR